MIKKIVVITLIAMLCACSNNFVTTNLDKNNFTEYFSASEVKIYQSGQEINARHQFIGLVEGQDCQVKSHHAAPDEINARSQARRQAFEQQANGVVFTGCALLNQQQLAKLNSNNDAQQCHAIVICYAKAFAVDTSSEQ